MPPKVKDAGRLLHDCVRAVEDEEGDGAAIRTVYRALTAADLAKGAWPEALYEALSRNELLFQLGEALDSPRPLDELPEVLGKKIGRAITEAEILAWLGRLDLHLPQLF